MIFRRFLTIAVLLLALTSPAFALSIDPLRVELTAAAGQTAAGKLTIRNAKSEPVQVRIQTGLYRYAFSSNTVLPTNPADQKLPSCESWIHLAQSEMTLPPGQSADLNFTVQVPANTSSGSSGEYVAALLVDELPATSAPKEGSGKLTLLPRVAIPLYVMIQGKDELKGQVLGFTVGNGPKSGVSKFELNLGNEGQVHVRPSGTFLIADQQKQIVHRSSLGKTIPIFPKFQEKIPIWVELKPGIYTAVITVDFGGSNLMQREMVFEVTPEGQTHEDC